MRQEFCLPDFTQAFPNGSVNLLVNTSGTEITKVAFLMEQLL